METNIILSLQKKWLKWRIKKSSRFGKDIKGWESVDGWLTPLEAMALYAFARKVPLGGCIVEIGSWKGKSTLCLAQGLRNGHVHAIDPFDASGEQESHVLYTSKKDERPLLQHFQENMQRHGFSEKVITCPGFSRDYADKWDTIHFLFIDGDHSIEGADYDFQVFAPKLKPGGYIAFHDYDATRKDLGPTWVVQQRIINNPQFREIGIFDSLWVGQRTMT